MFAERKNSEAGRSLWSKLKRKAARRYKSAAAAPAVAPLASLLEPLEPRLLLAAGPYVTEVQNNSVSSLDLTVQFSQPINSATLNAGTLQVYQSISPVGRVGGSFQAVDVEGTIAYVGGGAGLDVIDVSDTSAPVRIGRYDTNFSTQGIQVEGSLAYLAMSDGGLLILDVSNPSAPALVGSHDTPGRANDVTVVGSLAYVADGGSGIQIFDVSLPSAPILVGAYDTSGDAEDVEIVGSLAYVATDNGGGGLEIIDVSSPSAPELVGTYTSTFTDGVSSVQVVGSLAYITMHANYFEVVDVSSPWAPVKVTGEWTNHAIQELRIVDSLAYAAGSGGIEIFDISSPSSPLRLGVYDDLSGEGSDIQIVGTLAYLADEVKGLQIIDVSSSLSPTWVGGYRTVGGFATTAAQVIGSLAYVTDNNGLQIFDVSTSSSPVRVGGFEQGGARYVLVVGTLAYLACYQDGLLIVDVSDPSAPALVGTCDTPGRAWHVQIVDGLAYVADREGGLQVIDVSTPSAPALLGGYDTPGDANSVHVSGSTAYVADGSSGLQIIDVSSPSVPVRVGGFDTSGFASGVRVAGTLAYVADGYQGLQIINVSSPSSPARVGGYDTQGFAKDVVYAGNRVLVADGDGGIQVVDVSSPAAPVLGRGYAIPGTVNSMHVVGSLTYVANEQCGLQILEIPTLTPSIAWTVTDLGSARYRLQNASGTGEFQVVIGPGVKDPQGRSMDQDQDGTAGESGDAYVRPVGVSPAQAAITGLWLVRQLDYDKPGDGWSSHDYHMGVLGVDLRRLRVTTAWGETFDSATWLGGDWDGTAFFFESGRIEFLSVTREGQDGLEVWWDDLQDGEWAALDSGMFTITIDYAMGSWTGKTTISGVVQPTQEPVLVSPGNGGIVSALRPTLTWNAWTSPGASSMVEIDFQRQGIEWLEDGELQPEQYASLAGSATSWTPPAALKPGNMYEAEINFTNYTTVTVNGVDVRVEACTQSDPQFAIEGIGAVMVRKGLQFGLADRSDDSREYGLEVIGANIANIVLQTPWGERFTLADLAPAAWDGASEMEVHNGGMELEAESWEDNPIQMWYEFGWDWLSDAQWASLTAAPGIITIQYGSGRSWSGVVDFAGVAQVTQEPLFTNLQNRQVLGSSPTIEWTPWAGAPADGTIFIEIEEERQTYWDDFDEQASLPSSSTSWTPPTMPNSDGYYEARVTYVNGVQQAIGGIPVTRFAYSQGTANFVVGDYAGDDHGNVFGEATPIAVGELAAGRFDYLADIDWFRFDAVAGQVYDIRLRPTDDPEVDTALWLYGPDGKTQLTWNDDGGEYSSSRIVWKAPASGRYYLAADTTDLDNGPANTAYTLQVNRSALAASTPAAVFATPIAFALIGPTVGLGESVERYTGATAGGDDVGILHVLNLDNPLAPADAARMYMSSGDCPAASADGRYLYTVDRAKENMDPVPGYSELVVWDLVDRARPVEVSRTRLITHWADTAALQGNYLFIGGEGNSSGTIGLDVYDVSSPAHPVYIGSNTLAEHPLGWGTDPEGIILAGNRAYVQCEDPPCLAIYDITNPAAPVVLGVHVVPAANSDDFYRMVVDGNTAWLAVGSELRAWDVTDASNPVVLGSVSLRGRVMQIALEGGLAYVGCAQTGVEVVDISDASNPAVVSRYTVPGASGSVGVRDGAVYVPTFGGQMSIFRELGAAEVQQVVFTAGLEHGTAGAADDHYRSRIRITGVAMTDVRISLPWGETASVSDFVAEGWNGVDDIELHRGALSFTCQTRAGVQQIDFVWNYLDDARYAELLGEQVGIAVAYGDGLTWSDSLTLAGLAEVSAEPTVTSVAYRGTVAADATFAWDEWADRGERSTVRVAVERFANGWQPLPEAPLPGGATQWQLSGMTEGEAGILHLAFLNTRSSTVNGVIVTTATSSSSKTSFVVGTPADDHGNSYAEATPVSLGGTVTASLNYAGDIDFFRFTAIAGQVYRFSSESGNVIRLYDTDGLTPLATSDEGAALLWLAPADGEYFFAVDADEFGDNLGGYAVTVDASGVTADVPVATFASSAAGYLPLRGNIVMSWSRCLHTGAIIGSDAYTVVELLDFTDPVNPVKLSSIGVYAEDPAVSLDGRYIYLVDDRNADALGHSEIVVFDAQDPRNPLELRRIALQHYDVDSVAIGGGYLYAGVQPEEEAGSHDAGQFAVEVYSLADPATPSYVGQSATIANPRGSEYDFDPDEMLVAGSRLYVLNDEGGISTFSLAAPVSPQYLGTYWPAGDYTPRRVAAVGATLWYAQNNVLHSVDMTDPASPAEIGSVALDGGIADIQVVGERAYLGCVPTGLRVVDISDPANPQVVRSATVLNASGSILRRAGAVYVPTNSGVTAVFGQEAPDGYESDDEAGAAVAIATDGTAQQHSLHVGSDVDWVTFTLGETSNVAIWTAGAAGGDTVMRLYGPDDSTTLLAFDDDGGEGLYSQIVATSLPAGQYYVKIESYNHASAIETYDISVSAEPALAGDAFEYDNTPSSARWIVPGAAAQNHSLHAGSDVDWVKFELLGRSDATVSLNAAGDISGQLYAAGDLAHAIATAAGSGPVQIGGPGALEPGTYYVRIAETGADATIDSYSVAVGATLVEDAYAGDDSAAGASEIAIDGTPQTHNLHTGADVDWVTFVLAGASEVTIQLSGRAGDPEVRLYGPNDPTRLVAQDDDSGEGYFPMLDLRGAAALAAGRYWVQVLAHNGAAVPSYDLSVLAVAGHDVNAPGMTITSSADGGLRLDFSEPVLTNNVDEGSDVIVTDSAGRRVFGTITWPSDRRMLWTPDRRPAAGDTWTVTIAGGDDGSDLVDRSWNSLGADYIRAWPVAPSDFTPPAVIDFEGLSNGVVSVQFGEAIATGVLADNPRLIGVVNAAGAAVAGTYTWSTDRKRLTWTPAAAPAGEDVWTLRLSAGKAGQLGDSAGNLLDGDGDGLAGGDYVQRWSVGAAGPRVEVCKTLEQGRVVIDFSEQMLASSLRNHVNLWVQDANGLEVQGRLVWSKGNRRLTWEPRLAPIGTEQWTIALAGGEDGLRSAAGTLLDGDADGSAGGAFRRSWQVSSSSNLPLTVLAFEPGLDGVAIFDFSRPVLASNIEAGWDVRVTDGAGRAVPGSIRWMYDNTRLIWTPDSPPAAEDTWTIALSGRDGSDFVDTQFGRLQGGDAALGGDSVHQYRCLPSGSAAAVEVRPDIYDNEAGNDTPDQAVLLDSAEGAARLSGLSLHRDDVDWFSFHIDAGTHADAVFVDSYRGASADITLELYAADGSTVLATATAEDLAIGGRRSRIDLGGLGEGDYYVRVSGPQTGEYTLTAQLPAQDQEKWTVLYYIAGDNDLDGAYCYELDQMEQLSLPSNVRVGVLLDRSPGPDAYRDVAILDNWSGTRRGWLGRDTAAGSFGDWLEPLGEQDMGSGDVLQSFLEWAKASSDDWAQGHYVLNIVNHGGAHQGVCWDISSSDAGQTSHLSLSELGQALQGADLDLDILVMNTCLSGMAELAAEVADKADYLVASQELSFSGSMPLQLGLFEYETGRGAQRLAGEIAQAAAGNSPSRVEVLGRTLYTTQSVLELDQIAEINQRIAEFVAACQQHLASDADWQPIHRAIQRATAFHVSTSRDLGGFMLAVASSPEVDEDIRSAATAVREALGEAVEWNFTAGGAAGLAVSLPHSLAWDFDADAPAFDAATNWGDFLRLLRDHYSGSSSTSGDWAEPNDRLQDAYQLRPIEGKVTLPDLRIDGATDNDVFLFELRQDGATASYVQAVPSGGGALSLTLRDRKGAALATSPAGGSSIPLAGVPAGTYYVQIAPAGTTTHCGYSLLFDAPLDVTQGDWANGNQARATAYGLDVRPNVAIPNVALLVNKQAPDWFYIDLGSVTNGSGGYVQVSPANTGVVLEVYAEDGNQPLTNSSANKLRFDIPSGLHGRLYVKVSTTLATPQAYGLTVQGPTYELPENLHVLALRLGTGGVVGSKSILYKDADGSTVTLSLTGPGSVLATFVGNLAAAPPPNSLGVIDLTARPAWLAELMLSGTRDTSALTMTAKGGSVGGAVIGSILCESDNGIVESLVKLDAAGISVRGDIVIEGSLGMLKVANVEAGRIDIADELVAADIKTKALTATMGRVSDVRLDTHLLPIQSLTVTEWRKSTSSGGDTFEDAISAPRIVTLTATGVTANALTGVTALAGRFEADVTLSGAGLASTLTTLGTATIAGDLSGLWNVTGSLGTVTAKGAVADWSLSAVNRDALDTMRRPVVIRGNVASLVLGCVGSASVDSSGVLTGVTAVRWQAGSITAAGIGSLKATGLAATLTRSAVAGVFGPAVTLSGAGLLATQKTLASASVSGEASGLWNICGPVGTVALNGKVDEFHLSVTDRVVGATTLNGDISGLTLGVAEDVEVSAAGSVTTLKAARWERGTLSADAVGSLSSTGCFGARVLLTGGSLVPTVKTLASATIAGALSGQWTISGAAGSVTVTGDADSWTLDVLDRAAVDSYHRPVVVAGSVATLALGVVRTADVTAGGTLGTLSAVRWEHGSVQADAVASLSVTGRAASPGKPAIAGDFSASLLLSGDGLGATVKTLGSATVAGAAVGAWQAAGLVGTVKINGRADGWQMNVNDRRLAGANGDTVIRGAVTSLALGVTGQATVNVSDLLGTVTAVRWERGSLQARRVNSLTVTGRAATTSAPAVAGDLGIDVRCGSIGTVSVAGSMTGSTWRVDGDVGAITVKSAIRDVKVFSGGSQTSWSAMSLVDSSFMAGVNPMARFGEGHEFTCDDFVNKSARIGSVTALGRTLPAGDQTSFVEDLMVVAPQVGTISLRNPADDALAVFVTGKNGKPLVDLVKCVDSRALHWNGQVTPKAGQQLPPAVGAVHVLE